MLLPNVFKVVASFGLVSVVCFNLVLSGKNVFTEDNIIQNPFGGKM